MTARLPERGRPWAELSREMTDLKRDDLDWLWGVALLLIVLSIGGKGLACLAAARVAGESWRESLTIGILMNARGLMELIILNIGRDRGIITPTLFTIMVLMAIVTTLMASPLFELVYRRSRTVVSAGAPSAT